MNDWVRDIHHMHDHYGFHDDMETLDKEKLRDYLQFRIKFLQEELDEMKEAVAAEDVVDALIDLIVVAIGTLDLYEVNAHESWNRVHHCNMQKRKGVKASRPNPFGLPDLMKPDGWIGPEHHDNVGRFGKLFD